MYKKIILFSLVILSCVLFSCEQKKPITVPPVEDIQTEDVIEQIEGTMETIKYDETDEKQFKDVSDSMDLLVSSKQKSEKQNFMWVGTFNLVWNELKEKYIQDEIYFEDGEQEELLKNLNTEPFDKTELNEKSYYIKSSEKVSEDLKKEIEEAIKSKFNETSDILQDFDFSNQDNSLFIYAMLKKDFKFVKEFTKLSADKFANGDKQIDYFGINDTTDNEVRDYVQVLFYNNENEYAVCLQTQDEDEVILYRTDKKMTLAEYYDELNKNENYEVFSKKDTLKVPVIKLTEKKSFNALENHVIKGTNKYISKAIENVKFNMNEKGVYLKSEAGMMMMKTSLMEENELPRAYNFDKGFTLFLKEKDAEQPYFMMRVENDEIFD